MREHISDEKILLWNQNTLNYEERCLLLQHVTECEFCAERLAMETTMQIEPPRYLKDLILQGVKKEVGAKKQSKMNAKQKMNLFLYSLKVSIAIASAMVVLFTMPFTEVVLEKMYQNNFTVQEEYRQNLYLNENDQTEESNTSGAMTGNIFGNDDISNKVNEKLDEFNSIFENIQIDIFK